MFCLTLASVLLAADARDVEAQALASRRAITSCHLVMRVTGFQSGGNKRLEYGKAIEVWLDGDKLRVDSTSDKTATSKEPAGYRRTMCRNCLKPGHTTAYTHHWSQVETVPNTKDATGAVGTFRELFDPRQLGFCLLNHSQLRNYGLDFTVGSADRKDIRLEEGQYAGQKAWVIRSTTIRAGADLRVWILPGRGYMVGRIEASAPGPGVPWVYTLESDLREDEESHVWYPRKYTYRQVHGGSLDGEEVVEVREAQYNRRVDPKVFTLAAWDIAPGTPVQAPNEPARYWNGSGLQKKDPAPLPSIPPPDERAPEPAQPLPGSGRWWYGAAAMLAAVAAVLFFRRALVRRM